MYYWFCFLFADTGRPNNLNAEQDGGDIRVTWDDTSDSDAIGYRIYYKLEPDGDENVFQDVDGRSTDEATIDVTVGGVYSITIVSRGNILPSTVVGPVNVTVGKHIAGDEIWDKS